MGPSHLEFLCLLSHLPFDPARLAAPKYGRSDMTLFYSHHDRLHGSAGTSHHPVVRTLKRVRGALRTLTGRSLPQNCRIPRADAPWHAYHWAQKADLGGRPEKDATKYPRRPLVLGEKWDF